MHGYLVKKATSGFIWMGLATVGNIITQLSLLAILARILEPLDFGLMSIVVIVVTLVSVINNSGFSQALINNEYLTKSHISAAFIMSSSLGIGLACVLYLSASTVAAYFEENKLEEMLKIASVILILDGIAQASTAILRRRFMFKYIAIRNFISYLLGYGVVGLSLAYAGMGVYSLLFAWVCQSIINTLFVLMASPVNLKFGILKREIKDLFDFGWKNVASSLMSRSAVNIDKLLVGKILGGETLGIYAQGYKLMAYPANLFGEVFGKVLFPVLSRMQKDFQRINNFTYLSDFLLSIIILPLIAVIYIFSHNIVFIILGDKWLDVVPLLKIFSLGIFFRLAYKIDYELLKSLGRVGLLSFLQALYFISVVIAVVFGAKYGELIGVAYGVLLSLVFNYIVLAFAVLVTCNQSIFLRLLNIIPGIALAVLIYLVYSISKKHFSIYDSFYIADLIVICLYMVICLFIVVMVVSSGYLKNRLRELG